MLKPGIVFIGKPSIHLHELLCLALYLEAPIALSDEVSFEIAKKFSGIIPVFKFSNEFNFNYFVSDKLELYTNLLPEEVAAFFEARPDLKRIKVMHIVENGLSLLKSKDGSLFCSSFLHTKSLIPINSQWINLGPIGPLSYQKHKKKLKELLYTFMPKQEECLFYITQILNDVYSKRFKEEDTLDQIRFLNLAFSGFDAPFTKEVLPAHGLIDAAIDLTSATIITDESLAVLSLNHKKPFLSHFPLTGHYDVLSPLISQAPKDPKNLVPLVENYFEFETINREEMIKKGMQRFFNKSYFSS
jgi:hypothetical protein